jgi:hypothetical protein
MLLLTLIMLPRAWIVQPSLANSFVKIVAMLQQASLNQDLIQVNHTVGDITLKPQFRVRRKQQTLGRIRSEACQ